MSCKIKTISVFDKQAHKLAKHYASFRNDLASFVRELKENPTMGTDLGNGVRKVRISIASKGKGKSGGARVITYSTDILIHSVEGTIYLLSVYDKSSQSTISDKEIKRLIKLTTL
jgi:hypothetical protein